MAPFSFGAEASCLQKRRLLLVLEFGGVWARGIPAGIAAAEISGVFAEIIFNDFHHKYPKRGNYSKMKGHTARVSEIRGA